jgi:hypothetical protein
VGTAHQKHSAIVNEMVDSAHPTETQTLKLRNLKLAATLTVAEWLPARKTWQAGSLPRPQVNKKRWSYEHLNWY